jgi:hypothetical protein
MTAPEGVLLQYPAEAIAVSRVPKELHGKKRVWFVNLLRPFGGLQSWVCQP